MLKIPIFFLLAPLSALILYAALRAPAWSEHYMLAAGAAAYCMFATLDVRSTVRFGRRTVCSMESSPVFSWAARHGLRGAIAVQCILELFLAVLAVPYFAVYSMSAAVTGAALLIMGAIHCTGYSMNRRLLRRT
ncbi:hypothetical protein CENSYa_0673 [Cenarchaeum symbiosum A]|uniref:Uncharacterized protein n=1 Tax=Cenarchaeum symbiosum (strain A) TaxID=414004 RepID=A0RVD9_CENSY|nr:hypothetical protein CENSYa_0673 [Cenarchaeum symbiosum A]